MFIRFIISLAKAQRNEGNGKSLRSARAMSGAPAKKKGKVDGLSLCEDHPEPTFPFLRPVAKIFAGAPLMKSLKETKCRKLVHPLLGLEAGTNFQMHFVSLPKASGSLIGKKCQRSSRPPGRYTPLGPGRDETRYSSPRGKKYLTKSLTKEGQRLGQSAVWPVLLSNIPSSFQSSGSRRAMEC